MHTPRLPRLLRTAAACLLLTTLAATVTAQNPTFTIYGKVVRKGSGYELADVNIPLTSSKSLRSFVGESVEIRGSNTGTTAKPVIKVSTIKETDDTFEIDGDAKIGGRLELEIESEKGRYYYMFLSLGRGFTPTDNLYANLNLRGTFFLDLNAFYLFGPGKLYGEGKEKVPVPNATVLIGLRVWAQGAVVFPGGSAAYLNADSIVLRKQGT
jgi:hypothetical protein